MTIENVQFPAYMTDVFYCDFQGLRIIGTNYQGNAPQYAVRLSGCQYCTVMNCVATNMTVLGVTCDASAARATYGHMISNNYMQMAGGIGYIFDATSGGIWLTGNRVTGAAPPFSIGGSHPATSNNISV
jgi:hypothetical protein